MTQSQTTDTTNLLGNAPCHATLTCTDIDQTRDFYTNVLGLNVIQESAEQGIMFGAGDGTRLYVYPRPDLAPAENTVCAFNVADVRATVTALQNNGVTFEEYDLPNLKTENGIAQMGDDVGAWFKDPTGNIIAISSM